MKYSFIPLYSYCLLTSLHFFGCFSSQHSFFMYSPIIITSMNQHKSLNNRYKKLCSTAPCLGCTNRRVPAVCCCRCRHIPHYCCCRRQPAGKISRPLPEQIHSGRSRPPLAAFGNRTGPQKRAMLATTHTCLCYHIKFNDNELFLQG